jgi:hypothetical protein
MSEGKRLTPSGELYEPMMKFVKRALGEEATARPEALAIVPGLIKLLIEKYEYCGPTRFDSRLLEDGTRTESHEEFRPRSQRHTQQSEAERS